MALHEAVSGGNVGGDGVLDPSDPVIQREILLVITQYLQDAGFSEAAAVLQDEAAVHEKAAIDRAQSLDQLRDGIFAGAWESALQLCKQQLVSAVQRDGPGGVSSPVTGSSGAGASHPAALPLWQSFFYAAHRQHYLEVLDRGEYQQAFSFLTKRLKPLEKFAPAREMKDLCYLLTCKSVQDAPAFRGWDQASGRRDLVRHLDSIVNSQMIPTGDRVIPPQRLVTLLKQAVAYQVQQASAPAPRRKDIEESHVTSLLCDASSPSLPTRPGKVLKHHSANVKCLTFAGIDDRFLASGSSDNTVCVWTARTGELHTVLKGHTSRVWDIDASHTASGVSLLASASADRTVRVWNLDQSESNGEPVVTCSGHDGDVYSVAFHPDGNHLLSGSYDHSVRLADVRTGQMVRTFDGHTSSVSKAIFNGYGNLIVSGSKDQSVRLWDMFSGCCIKTISGHFSEATSVALNPAGDQLLVASRSNMTTLFDLRMYREIRRFRGHQNTSKNFVRARFGPNPSLIIGGSEDGAVYMWDTGEDTPLPRLLGHAGVVYDVRWSQKQQMLASCSEDTTVRTWVVGDSSADHAGE